MKTNKSTCVLLGYVKSSCFIAIFLIFTFSAYAQTSFSGEQWITNADKSSLFRKQAKPLTFSASRNADSVIQVNEQDIYQEIDGFGFTLTGGSAQLISQMTANKRSELLKDLFSWKGNAIGISYLRISVGASDLNDHVFSYDDLPTGETDLKLNKFDLGPDKKDVIPVLREILAINPNIKILASPWSAPVWMKDNNDTRGGSLKPEYFDVYAKYLIKYIKEMKKEGIIIDALTIQNEPLHPGNNPSMLMLAIDQAKFIKVSLGPEFKKANVKTKIVIYDHNCDKPEYPLSILNDPEANKYVDGSAFHLYGGKITALSQVHDAFPKKALYFTEQWMGAPGNFQKDISQHINKLTIGATRNWSRNVLEWNLAADPNSDPHTDRGGCSSCLGGITIDKDSVTRNPAYYVVAHAAKFVRPGSFRIGSNLLTTLPNVAFETPEKKYVLIVINNASVSQNFNITFRGSTANVSLLSGSVGTYVWQ